jgi:hypothetical protein
MRRFAPLLLIVIANLQAGTKPKSQPVAACVVQVCLVDVKWELFGAYDMPEIRGFIRNDSQITIRRMNLSFVLKFRDDLKGSAITFADMAIPPGSRWAFRAPVLVDATLTDTAEIEGVATLIDGSEGGFRETIRFTEPVFNPRGSYWERRWWQKKHGGLKTSSRPTGDVPRVNSAIPVQKPELPPPPPK